MSDRRMAVELLAKNNSVMLVCNGASMKPIMSKGDSLLIQKVDVSMLRPGDAVFCKINGLQVHKIGTIDKDRFMIENNHGHKNGWINANSIYGLCTKVNDRVLVNLDDRKN